MDVTQIKAILASILAIVTSLSSQVANIQTQQPEPRVGAAIPSVVALFESSLTSKISKTDTSMTLVNGLDKSGATLSGYIGFIIDEGTASEEFVAGTASGTAITGMLRGINPTTGNTTSSALAFVHNRGASVKITTFPVLGIITRQLNGQEGIPNPIYYDPSVTTSSFTTSSQLVNYGYVSYLDGNNVKTSGNQTVAGTKTFSSSPKVPTPISGNDAANYSWVVSQVVAGGVTASTSTPGISKLSVTPASSTNPIVVGDNDPRLSGIASNLYGVYTASTATFNTTGTYSLYIPLNATSAVLVAKGASGGAGSATAGFGGIATGTLALSAGQNYFFAVGGQGGASAGGYNGGGAGGTGAGGGGGMTWFSTTSTFATSSVLLVGAGGGGGSTPGSGNPANGGNGGGLTGAAGPSTNYAPLASTGGTQSAAGASGSSAGTPNASAGVGGAGGTGAFSSGGGGGAGYYGGGGGGGSGSGGTGGGGGAGGSSYMASSLTATSTGAAASAASGSLSITFSTTTANGYGHQGAIYFNASTSIPYNLLFSTPFSNTPACVLTANTNTYAYPTNLATTGFTINAGTKSDGMIISYLCF